MFDLPYGMPVDDEIDVSDGSILPFENGSVTTYLGRRSTASGHRIIRAGRVVGWIAEPAKGKVLLCGKAAKDRLETLENWIESQFLLHLIQGFLDLQDIRL